MPTLALLFVALIWGTTFVAVKAALAEIQPLHFLSLRFTIAALASLPLLRPGPGFRRALLLGAPLGITLACGFGAQTLGLMTTTPARSGFITGLNVLMIPLWGAWLLRRRPGWLPTLGLLVATAGMWCLTRPAAGGWSIGDTWTIACAVAFGLHVVLLSKYGTISAPGAFLFSQMATTALIGWVGHWLFESGAATALGAGSVSGGPSIWTSAAVWRALLLTGVLASLVTTWLQMRYQPRTSPVRVAIIFATEPLFAAVFSMLFWGERLGMIGWLGGGLILVGMAVAEVDSAREPAGEP
ncbi:MAG: DMT family transporter [Candidatus Eisenbacteria bacterium]